MAAETSLPNILCAGLQSVRSCLLRSDFRESVLLGFIEPTKVDPPRMSIVSIDTELLFGVIKGEIDIFHIGSPLAAFMTTFDVCQRRKRDPVPGEVRHYVGEQHGPLACSLDKRWGTAKPSTVTGANPEFLRPSPTSVCNDSGRGRTTVETCRFGA
ncbi:MAG: hypothetical protein ACLP9Y_32910 [Mycobacterium sp.]